MSNAYDEALYEVGNYSDPDAYASDMYLSSVWEDKGIPLPPYDWFLQIWQAGRRSMADILAASGMTRPELAEYFHVPYRTMQNWCLGTNDAPVYLRMMMQEILGLVKRDYEPDPGLPDE